MAHIEDDDIINSFKNEDPMVLTIATFHSKLSNNFGKNDFENNPIQPNIANFQTPIDSSGFPIITNSSKDDPISFFTQLFLTRFFLENTRRMEWHISGTKPLGARKNPGFRLC
mgnify:CR=1 FL=1